jgi:hypothetical protein
MKNLGQWHGTNGRNSSGSYGIWIFYNGCKGIDSSFLLCRSACPLEQFTSFNMLPVE